MSSLFSVGEESTFWEGTKVQTVLIARQSCPNCIYTYLVQTAYLPCPNCMPMLSKLHTTPSSFNCMPIANLRPLSDHFKSICFKKVDHQNWVFMCMTFPILWKCTIILLIQRASASQAHSPGADVTKFKSVQKYQLWTTRGQPDFGRKRSLWMQNQSGPGRSCAQQSDQTIFISLKALCRSYHQCRMSRRRRWFQPKLQIYNAQIQFTS